MWYNYNMNNLTKGINMKTWKELLIEDMNIYADSLNNMEACTSIKSLNLTADPQRDSDEDEFTLWTKKRVYANDRDSDFNPIVTSLPRNP